MNGLKAEVGSSCNGGLSYKKLYHASVERGSILQKQLSELLSKHSKIAELKVGSY